MSPTTVVRTRHVVEPDEVERWLRPRHDVVRELPGTSDDDGTTTAFALDTGPVHLWERTVTVAPVAPATPMTTATPTADATPTAAVEVTEEVRYRLAVPVWGRLFRFALDRHLRRPPRDPAAGAPWWAPSVVIDARAATVLSLLCVIGAVAGYLGTLLTQMLTYAAEDFGAGTGAQGTLLASVRVGVLLSLVIVSFADRRGRRSVLIASVIGACLFTGVAALAPGMVFLGVAQTFSRAVDGRGAAGGDHGGRGDAGRGPGLLGVGVDHDRRARGGAVRRQPRVRRHGDGGLAHRLPRAPAGHLPVLADRPPPPRDAPLRGPQAPPLHRGRGARRARHRRRHLRGDRGAVADLGVVLVAGRVPHRLLPRHFAWRRFVLLACSGFLWSLFLAPAAQFLNEFLRTERGFSGALIAVFVLVTNTPAGIGIVAGGKLADRHGRRVIGAVGVIGGVGFTVVSYLAWGWPLWLASLTASVIGALAVPALAVYGPELFPTGQRGAANGGLQVVSVAGSSTGLLLAGWMADRLGGLGPAMAVLAIGPLVLAVLVLTLFPETAGRELEDLNPEDRPPGAEDPAGGGTTIH